MSIIAIRADAGMEAGLGHAMRCFALAEAMQLSEHQVLFVFSECPREIQKKFADVGVSVVKYSGMPNGVEDGRFVADLDADWVIVDGYHFAQDFFTSVASNGAKIMALDDELRVQNFVADIVLNQNPLAEASWYSDQVCDDRLLCGAEYILLREEFRLRRENVRPVIDTSNCFNVLLTTGGSDEMNVASRAITALGPILSQSFRLNVLIGGSSPFRNETLASASEFDNVVCVSDKEGMAELIGQSNFVISSAGSTVWECVALGVPFMTLILSENQQRNANFLEKKGIARTAGFVKNEGRLTEVVRLFEDCLDNDKQLNTGVMIGRQLIDGNGVFRVIDRLSA